MGLKDDPLKNLEEVIHVELVENADNAGTKSDLTFDQAQAEAVDSEKAIEGVKDMGIDLGEKVDAKANDVQVTRDSLSAASVSLFQEMELKVDVITDNVQLGTDVKHEMVQPWSSTPTVCASSEFHPMVVEEPLCKQVMKEPLNKKMSMELAYDSNAENANSLDNIDFVDLSPAEKCSVDHSFGNNFTEKDLLQSSKVEYNSDSNKIGDNIEKSQMPIEVIDCGKLVETKDIINAENMSGSTQMLLKRKFNDKETVGHNVAVKKARTEVSDTPKPTFRRYSVTGSEVTEAPKERTVPPSLNPPTNSLRIDRFLRPFTLKAVQELLGKTGMVTSFWMDWIKTHCYVSYSSVEEAIKTRDAVYNLQWPPNGGRLLVAEFVDPQEVKVHVIGTPPVCSNSTIPKSSTSQTHPGPSPRQQVPAQKLPPPTPLPPLSNLRAHVHPSREPMLRDWVSFPPPPLHQEKIDTPAIRLNDIFQKTRAAPRIYYQPLSDEQVAAKLKSQGKYIDQ